MTPILSEAEFTKQKTIHNLRRVLQREGEGYLRALHARCGVGFTNTEFDSIVQALVDGGLCSLKVGRQRALLVVLNEKPKPISQPLVELVAATA